MRSCRTHPGGVERPHSRLLNPKCFIREACLWCARNVEDAGLSASCQLGNYPASLPGAAEATEPMQPSVAQRPCRWLTRLIPWNAGLSYHSLVNDFIQAGWGHQRLWNKGAALCSKNSTPVCCSPKKERKKGRKEGHIQVSFGCGAALLEQEASKVKLTFRRACLNSYFPFPIIEEIIIGRSMNY